MYIVTHNIYLENIERVYLILIILVTLYTITHIVK